MPFPKIIHQIWIQGETNIPSKYHDNINSLKLHNPDYTYILWDEIKILEIIQQNETWVNTYYSFVYLHQKADYARYIILLIYGGIYVDIDVKALKTFNELLEKYSSYELIVSLLNVDKIISNLQCSNNKCLNNGVIIAKKNSLAINEMINYVNTHNKCNDYLPKVSCINNTTGPNAFTNVIFSFMKKNKKTVLLLKPEYLEPCTLGKCNLTSNTIVEHEHSGTWVPNWQYKIGQLYVHNPNIFYIIIIFVFFYIFYLMWKRLKKINL